MQRVDGRVSCAFRVVQLERSKVAESEGSANNPAISGVANEGN